MHRLKIAVVSLAALALVACTDGAGQKEGIGTLIGAAAGGLAGAQFGKGRGQLAATAAGALLGAFVGNEVGKSLDRADKLAMQSTVQQSLETAPMGTISSWQNPDSGNSGTVTPANTFQRTDGTYCREFSQTITVGGRTEEAYGTACRQADGSWKIVST
ncbi:MAG: RT0821/Lpp0805 family surface protein [Proteobacteria bacterium]|nr:RT0821/Lpp0805 family surface protein [Pseudomonadota bacterium]